MRSSGRFSCFLGDPTSKYFDEAFVNTVILNPLLEYKERTISVTPPEHCKYYFADKALVILITRY